MQELRPVLRPILSTIFGAVTVKTEEPIRDVLRQDTAELYDKPIQERLPIHDVTLKTRWSVLL